MLSALCVNYSRSVREGPPDGMMINGGDIQREGGENP